MASTTLPCRVTISEVQDHVYLSIPMPFNMFHKPLAIPFESMSVTISSNGRKNIVVRRKDGAYGATFYCGKKLSEQIAGRVIVAEQVAASDC